MAQVVALIMCAQNSASPRMGLNATTYGLWVKGVQVSSANYANILGDGTVSYAPSTNTLTLKNANITFNNDVIKMTQNMTIECIGENTISSTGSNDATITTTGSLTITGSGSLSVQSTQAYSIHAVAGLTIQGRCVVKTKSTKSIGVSANALTVNNANLLAGGNGTTSTIACDALTMTKTGILTGQTYDKSSHKFLTSKGEETHSQIIIGQIYSLYVGGKQVNYFNSNDILSNSTVSYDDATNTLTLNNATISCATDAPIRSDLNGLKVVCNGNNTLDRTGANGYAMYLTFGTTVTTTQANSTLTLNSPDIAVLMGDNKTVFDGNNFQLGINVNGSKGGFVGVINEGGGTRLTLKNAKVNISATTQGAIKNMSSFTLDGVEVLSPAGCSFSTTEHALVKGGSVVKEAVTIAGDERTVIKELSLSNLHAPTAGSVYTNDSMRASIRVPQDAGYGLKEGSVKLYKMTTSGAAQVTDNTTISTGRYYVIAQVSINDDAKEEYRFPNQLKDIKIKSVSPHKWRIKNLIGNEGVVCYSDTFTVFTAYAFPDELPDDLTELRGDTFRIYGNMMSLSDAHSNYKYLASSWEYHPNEYGYDPSFKKIYICFGGIYWEMPITSTVDWVDVYFAIGNTPFSYDYSYQPSALPTQRPDMKGASLVVCASNIENYFSNYKDASKVFAKSPATQEEFVTKTQKVMAAFTTIDAQLYAICEIGTGQSVHVLCDSLNKRYPNHPYAPLDCNFGTSTYQSVAYIYDSTKLDVVSAPTCMYASGYMYYRMSRVTFRERASQQELILSASHLKAFDDGESERIQQVNKLMTALRPYKQKNILIVGDMNSHSLDVPCQMLADEYEDLLYTHDSLGFSYLRGDGVAFLDHAYASSSLVPYVTMATAMHVNTLAPSNYGFASGDTTMYRFADHDPLLVGLNLPSATALEGVQLDQFTNLQTYKLIMGGQLLIKHNGKLFNAIGGRVR